MAHRNRAFRPSSAPCLRVLRMGSGTGYTEGPRLWVMHASCRTMGAVPRWAPPRASRPDLREQSAGIRHRHRP